MRDLTVSSNHDVLGIFDWKNGKLLKIHEKVFLREMNEQYYILERSDRGKILDIYRMSDFTRVGEIDRTSAGDSVDGIWFIAADDQHLIHIVTASNSPRAYSIQKYNLSDGTLVKNATLELRRENAVLKPISEEILLYREDKSPTITKVFSLDKLLNNDETPLMQLTNKEFSFTTNHSHTRNSNPIFGEKYSYMQFADDHVYFDFDSYKNFTLPFRIRKDRIRTFFASIGQSGETFDMPSIAKHLSKEAGEFIMRQGLLTSFDNNHYSIGEYQSPILLYSGHIFTARYQNYESENGSLIAYMRIFDYRDTHTSSGNKMEVNGIFMASPSGYVSTRTDLMSQYLTESLTPEQQLVGLYPKKSMNDKKQIIYNPGSATKNAIVICPVSSSPEGAAHHIYIFSNPFK